METKKVKLAGQLRVLGTALLGVACTAAAPGASADNPTPQRTESATPAECAALARLDGKTVLIPAGIYRPFFKSASKVDPTKPSTANQGVPKIPVPAFRMDAAAVTRGEYLRFVCEHPAWRKSNTKTLFAEEGYLSDWEGDLDAGKQPLDQPVTHISWFAARAFCAARNARLPTIAEWERAGGGSDAAAQLSVNPGAETTNPFRFAMGTPAPDLQRSGLAFGGIWEWTSDFNSVAAGSTDGNGSSSLFCGDGFRSNNARDYAAFLRYSFRSSLHGNYTLKNLGFRCVTEVTP